MADRAEQRQAQVNSEPPLPASKSADWAAIALLRTEPGRRDHPPSTSAALVIRPQLGPVTGHGTRALAASGAEAQHNHSTAPDRALQKPLRAAVCLD